MAPSSSQYYLSEEETVQEQRGTAESNVPHPGAEPPPDSMPNTPWNHSHLSQVLPCLYFANTASSEPRSHTKNNSVLNPTRLARSPLPWLGTLGFRLNRSRTRLPPPEASRPRGGKEGSGWPFSALPLPSHFGGGKALPPHSFPQGNAFSPQPSRSLGQAGWAQPECVPSLGQVARTLLPPGHSPAGARALTPTVRPCPVATPGRSRRARRS